MAHLNFVALAAAMALAFITLSSTPALVGAHDIAPVQSTRDVWDPLTDPSIEILQDVDDSDFDELPGIDDDDEEEEAKNLTRRKHHHKKHRSHKHKHRHSRAALHVSTGPDNNAKLIGKDYWVTWYSAHDLLNPACGAGKWQPSPRSHVAAVSGKSKLKCGDFLQLCASQGKKACVKVRVVDACPGCAVKEHIDLSKSAFLQLATGGLNQGEVHGIHNYDLGMKVTPWALNLFGGKLQNQGNSPWNF
ncbi:hypothetical protein V8E36_006683 [Tilletia maclaganii]